MSQNNDKAPDQRESEEWRKASRKLRSEGFGEMNYEQRRPPYDPQAIRNRRRPDGGRKNNGDAGSDD